MKDWDQWSKDTAILSVADMKTLGDYMLDMAWNITPKELYKLGKKYRIVLVWGHHLPIFLTFEKEGEIPINRYEDLDDTYLEEEDYENPDHILDRFKGKGYALLIGAYYINEEVDVVGMAQELKEMSL